MNESRTTFDASQVKTEKNALRKQYKLLRSELSEEEKQKLDRQICENTQSLASFRYAETVLMYAPTKGEINVMPIAEYALSCGKRIAFPRSNAENHTMDFKYVESLDSLVPGEFGIFEPSEDMPSVIDFSHSICIVPGLVFDKMGYRVGYGKGFYDRFFSNYRETKLGLIYSDFILDSVPRGRFDRRVDILVSERGVKIASSD